MPASLENVTFRAATKADVPFLLELRRQSMSAHLKASGVDPTDAERLERVMARFECAQVVLLSGEPIGLLKIDNEGNQWELLQLQILPAKQSTGFGSAILKELLVEAVKANASINLSVLKANPARAFYERFGFHVTSEDAYSFRMHFGS
jgi:ribosomal protein S18 acetylase RimI-like enzyme